MIETERDLLIVKVDRLIVILTTRKLSVQASDISIDETITYFHFLIERLRILNSVTSNTSVRGTLQNLASTPRGLDEMLIDWRDIPQFCDLVIEVADLSRQFSGAYPPN